MKEFIRMIGTLTLTFYSFLTKKHENSSESHEKTIDEKITRELLKNNTISITFSKKIMVLIIINAVICIINFQVGIETALAVLFFILFKKNLPKIREDKRKKEILKVLPFALRQLSTELKAGIGLFDAIKTISDGNYGELSREFKITINDIQYGTNHIEAFEKLSERVNADIMDKVINQIIRTLINGGNLADTLNMLANENSRNMKIKYKEYSEKLNSLMLLYMFIAVLIPVILFIMIIAATTVMGSIIKPELLLILYLFFFPMIIIFMITFIKRLEPTI